MVCNLFMVENPILQGKVSFLETNDSAEIIEALAEAIRSVRTDATRIVDFKRFGFVRLPLTSPDRTKDGYVLHVWKDAVSPDACPHTHSFDLTSRVLHGGIYNSRWEITDGSGDYTFVRPVCGQGQVTQEQSSVQLKCVETLRHAPDSYPLYKVGKNVFHSSATDPDTVTLVYRENVEVACPINAIQPGQQINVPPVALPQEEGWTIIDGAMSKIRNLQKSYNNV
jgi:hypothetical protein